MGTNQNPTPNPSTEGNQLDISQPRNSRFSNSSFENTLYKQSNPEFGAPLLSRCVSNGGSPQLELGNKNSLAFASDISSPVVIGRFCDLGITISREMPGWMKYKLESRLPGEISIASDMQRTPLLWQRAKRNWRASWWKWKRRVKKLA